MTREQRLSRRELLRKGYEVHQMMTVVGEEGTGIEDFTDYLKAEFFDNVLLQQNAFDDVDGASSAERQKFVFAKCLKVLRLDFEFETRPQARSVMFDVTDKFRNWNYAAWDSDEFKKGLVEIDEAIATKGRSADAADEEAEPAEEAAAVASDE